MSDNKHEEPHRELQLVRNHQESNTMLAIVMAGLGALFILAIAAAYNYASNTSTAEIPRPGPTASGSATTGARAPAETTGSGSTEKPMQVTPDKSQKQN